MAITRAMNLALPEADVQALCTAAGIAISAIEPLPAGGTHLVCLTIEGADAVRARLGSHLIPGAVRRFPFYRGRPD